MLKKNILKISEIVSESKYVLFYNVFDRLFYFLFFLLIARNYPLETYGELITIFTLSSIVSLMFDLGISYHLQREISRSPEDKNVYFNLAMRLNLFLFIPYILTSLLLYYSLVNNLLIVFLIIIIINFVISQVNICNKALSAVKNFKYQFDASFYPKIIFVILFVVLVFAVKASLVLLLLCLLIFLILNLVLAMILCSKEGLYIKRSNVSRQYYSFLKLSFPLGLAIIINLLYDKIDILLVSKLTSFTEAGIYNAAYSIFKASSLGFSFILTKGFSEFSEISDNNDMFKKFLFKYAKVITVICIAISVVLFFIPQIFVVFLYSSKFNDSGDILKILSLALIGLGLNNLLGTALNGRGEYKAVMFITLSALILNIVLNIIFIPVYGIKAAASITVLTEWFILAGEIIYIINLLNLKSKNAYI